MDTPVRLSPVELRNLSMINDPSLEGYRREELQGEKSAVSMKSGAVALEAAPPDDDESMTLGRIEGERIVVGPEVDRIEVGPNRPVAFGEVVVDKANPFFSSDGSAIYSKDGSMLVSLVVPCEEYEVLFSCRRIGDRAFDSVAELKSVKLPTGLVAIGRLAFAKSGLGSIDVPAGVRDIGEKAFYGCGSLLAVRLSEGLRSIGDEAFALSAVERLRLPASLEELGHRICDRTPLQRLVTRGALSIDPRNERYSIDRKGGIYREDELFELVSRVSDYVVSAHCTRIGSEAFRRNASIRTVTIPEGVRSIGENAFRGCRSLDHVHLPETLETIGSRTFMDTKVSRLYLGVNVSHIGDAALLVQGESSLHTAKPLASLDLDPANPRFFIESGVLCERGAGDSGADKALLYVGPDAIVTIPDSVNRIAPYAFFGARGIEELRMHDHMHSICVGSLSVGVSIPLVKVAVRADAASSRIVELPVPSFSSRYRTYTDLFTTDRDGTVFVFPYYDSWVSNTVNVDEFALCALARLRDPICLREDMEETYRDILRRKAAQVCLFFAKRGDLSALEDLRDLGVLDPSVVERALTEAMDDADARTLGCLFEMRRRSGIGPRVDLRI